MQLASNFVNKFGGYKNFVQYSTLSEYVLWFYKQLKLIKRWIFFFQVQFANYNFYYWPLTLWHRVNNFCFKMSYSFVVSGRMGIPSFHVYEPYNRVVMLVDVLCCVCVVQLSILILPKMIWSFIIDKNKIKWKVITKDS